MASGIRKCDNAVHSHWECMICFRCPNKNENDSLKIPQVADFGETENKTITLNQARNRSQKKHMPII